MSDKARLFMSLSGSTGAFNGESKVVGRVGWIEIDDWDWKMDAIAGTGTSASLGDGKAMKPSQLSFSKSMDRTSPSMLTSMGKGELLSATIELDDASQDYADLSIVLKNVRILSYDLRTEVGDKALDINERWEFDYESVVFKYKADSKSGVMQVELDRPVGSGSDASVRDKTTRFKELTDDMSVQDLEPIFMKILEEKRNPTAKTAEPVKK